MFCFLLSRSILYNFLIVLIRSCFLKIFVFVGFNFLVYLSIAWFANLFACLFVCLFACLFVCLSVCCLFVVREVMDSWHAFFLPLYCYIIKGGILFFFRERFEVGEALPDDRTPVGGLPVFGARIEMVSRCIVCLNTIKRKRNIVGHFFFASVPQGTRTVLFLSSLFLPFLFFLFSMSKLCWH